MMKYLFSLFLVFSFLVTNAQIKLLTLNDLGKRLAKGKDTTYVINFWATWCGPCVEELPHFEKVNKDAAKQPIKVILVSLDFKSKLKTAVIPFVVKNKLSSEVYVINEPDQQVFIEKVDKNWSGAIPATLFVNTHKKLRQFYEKEFSYNELIETLEKLK